MLKLDSISKNLLNFLNTFKVPFLKNICIIVLVAETIYIAQLINLANNTEKGVERRILIT